MVREFIFIKKIIAARRGAAFLSAPREKHPVKAGC